MGKEFGKSELVSKLISELGIDLVKQFSEQIVDKKKVASGKLINSLSFEVKQQLSEFIITFSSEKHLINVIDGRKPGTYPNLGAIQKWMKIKRIPKSATFPIMRSIYKFGIKPTPIISEVIDGGKTLDEFIPKIQDIFSVEMENNFTDLLDQVRKEFNK